MGYGHSRNLELLETMLIFVQVSCEDLDEFFVLRAFSPYWPCLGLNQEKGLEEPASDQERVFVNGKIDQATWSSETQYPGCQYGN